MSDSELTPSEPTSGAANPESPEAPAGAPAPSDTPVHDQQTAAGQAPDGVLGGEPRDPGDDSADTLQDDPLADEEQP